MGKKRKWLLKI